MYHSRASADLEAGADAPLAIGVATGQQGDHGPAWLLSTLERASQTEIAQRSKVDPQNVGARLVKMSPYLCNINCDMNTNDEIILFGCMGSKKYISHINFTCFLLFQKWVKQAVGK